MKFYVCIIGYLLLAAILQTAVGNYAFTVLAFPLNVLLALLWMALLWIGYREWRNAPFFRALLSPKCSIVSIVLFLAGCLVIGLFPQLPSSEVAQRSGLIARLGCYRFTESWIFIAILLLLMSNLGLVIIRAFYEKKRYRMRFMLNHAGLWIVLFAGFFGSADTQALRLPAYRDTPVREAYDEYGRSCTLPYQITFRKFRVEYFANGMPSLFEAGIQIDSAETVALKVNHPYSSGFGEDIYLTAYDTTRGNDTPYCILEIVHQPWRYVTLLGIVLMAGGALLLFLFGTKGKEAAV